MLLTEKIWVQVDANRTGYIASFINSGTYDETQAVVIVGNSIETYDICDLAIIKPAITDAEFDAAGQVKIQAALTPALADQNVPFAIPPVAPPSKPRVYSGETPNDVPKIKHGDCYIFKKAGNHYEIYRIHDVFLVFNVNKVNEVRSLVKYYEIDKAQSLVNYLTPAYSSY